jgi:cell filamentation protein, protein adenylyltransferase
MKPFVPDKLPLATLDWAALVSRIGPAHAAVAHFNGILEAVPNPRVLLSPLTSQEAVLSSRIEGTQAVLQEVLAYEAGARGESLEEKKGDIFEIINYRRALKGAAQVLENRPLSLQLIREMHSELMSGVRGGDKEPGRFRTIQNAIGKQGTPIEQAVYVPPAPEIVMEHLDDLAAYMAGDESDILVQLAIIHAQFEIIHPFHDGNGRVGRILIPLFLYQRGLLREPIFYLSEYLEAHREGYCEALGAISRKGQWQEWVAFFLDAVTEQANRNTGRVRAIMDLYDRIKRDVISSIRSPYASLTLDALFDEPVFSTSDFIKSGQFPNRAAAMRMLQRLQGCGTIVCLEEGRGRIPGIYTFPELMEITEG